jgi:hypothetical protein
MGFFGLEHGVIPALDVRNLYQAMRVVEATYDLEGLVALKLGRKLEINEKIPEVVERIEEVTDLPIIMDSQKEGNDTEFMNPELIQEYANAGIRSMILFSFSSPRTQKACVDACYERNILPIVGFELTQPLQFDSEEGRIDNVGGKIDERFTGKTYRGYIASDAPERSYKLYAELGVKDFVAPGNFPEKAKRLKDFLLDVGVKNPKFYLPGIGRQRGKPNTAMESTKGFPSYLIPGSLIHGHGKHSIEEMRNITKDICEVVLSYN